MLSRIHVIAVLSALSLGVAACGGAPATSQSGGAPIKIGVTLAMTGTTGFFGTEQSRGVQLATDAVNAAGGINGSKIQLDLRDYRSSTDEAVAIFNDFTTDDSMVATLGPTGSRDSLVVLKQTAKINMPSVTVSLAQGILGMGNNIYRPLPSDDDLIVPFIPQIAKQLSLKKIALLHVSDDPLATDVYNTYKSNFQKQGVQIVADESYIHSDTTWSAQLLKIKAANPDALVEVVYANEGGPLMAQTRQVGITAPILGSAALNSQNALDQAKSASDGLYVPDVWHIGLDNQANKDFLKAYKAKYPSLDPSRFAATGYMAMSFLIEALKKSSDPHKRTAVLQGMSKVTSFPAPSVPVSMADRHCVVRQALILKSQGGQFTVVK